jgi:hypothetical protein
VTTAAVTDSVPVAASLTETKLTMLGEASSVTVEASKTERDVVSAALADSVIVTASDVLTLRTSPETTESVTDSETVTLSLTDGAGGGA